MSVAGLQPISLKDPNIVNVDLSSVVSERVSKRACESWRCQCREAQAAGLSIRMSQTCNKWLCLWCYCAVLIVSFSERLFGSLKHEPCKNDGLSKCSRPRSNGLVSGRVRFLTQECDHARGKKDTPYHALHLIDFVVLFGGRVLDNMHIYNHTQYSNVQLNLVIHVNIIILLNIITH